MARDGAYNGMTLKVQLYKTDLTLFMLEPLEAVWQNDFI